jgi:hypothetical protein
VWVAVAFYLGRKNEALQAAQPSSSHSEPRE